MDGKNFIIKRNLDGYEVIFSPLRKENSYVDHVVKYTGDAINHIEGLIGMVSDRDICLMVKVGGHCDYFIVKPADIAVVMGLVAKEEVDVLDGHGIGLYYTNSGYSIGWPSFKMSNECGHSFLDDTAKRTIYTIKKDSKVVLETTDEQKQAVESFRKIFPIEQTPKIKTSLGVLSVHDIKKSYFSLGLNLEGVKRMKVRSNARHWNSDSFLSDITNEIMEILEDVPNGVDGRGDVTDTREEVANLLSSESLKSDISSAIGQYTGKSQIRINSEIIVSSDGETLPISEKLLLWVIVELYTRLMGENGLAGAPTLLGVRVDGDEAIIELVSKYPAKMDVKVNMEYHTKFTDCAVE